MDKVIKPKHNVKLLNRHAIFGILSAVPLFVLNAIIGMRIDPLYTMLQPFGITSTPGIITILVLFLFVGSLVSLYPNFKKESDGVRTFYVFNIIVAIILFVGFINIVAGIGEEIYRCDVLQIQNCD